MKLKLHSYEKIILLVLVFVAIVAIGGYSFAYFTTGLNVSSDGGAKTSVKTADLVKVEYASTKKINLENAVPGSSDTKNFTVKVTPTESQNSATYKIKLVVNTNEFKKCDDTTYDANSNVCTKNVEELVLSLTDDEGNTYIKDLTGITSGEEVLIATETKSPSGEQSYSYTLKIEFKNTNADQNHNRNKSLDAILKVEF